MSLSAQLLLQLSGGSTVVAALHGLEWLLNTDKEPNSSKKVIISLPHPNKAIQKQKTPLEKIKEPTNDLIEKINDVLTKAAKITNNSPNIYDCSWIEALKNKLPTRLSLNDVTRANRDKTAKNLMHTMITHKQSTDYKFTIALDNINLKIINLLQEAHTHMSKQNLTELLLQQVTETTTHISPRIESTPDQHEASQPVVAPECHNQEAEDIPAVTPSSTFLPPLKTNLDCTAHERLNKIAANLLDDASNNSGDSCGG
jgi:hypothetical protein